MAQLEEFHFGQLEEDPHSVQAIIVSLRKYGVPYKEIPTSKARLSTHDYCAEYKTTLTDALKDLYSNEYSRPPRACFLFRISRKSLSSTKGILLEYTLNWKHTNTTFEAFNPFCIPTDKIRQLTTIIEWHRLADYIEHPSDYTLNPILLTLPQGWLRVTKEHIDVFNTHQHPLFLKEWIEEVIESERVLSEVEVVNLFDKHDPLMKNKMIKLLEQLKIL